MADSDPSIDNRLWRIEQQQRDIFVRLDKLDAKAEEVAKRQGDRLYRINSLEHKIAEIEKKSPGGGAGMMTDSTVRVIIYGLIAGVVALAGGQAVNLTGLLK